MIEVNGMDIVLISMFVKVILYNRIVDVFCKFFFLFMVVIFNMLRRMIMGEVSVVILNIS